MSKSALTFEDVREAARSEQTFRKFCAEQRARTEEERLALLDHIPHTWWHLRVQLALRCLARSEHLERVFRDAITRADASGIRYVLGGMSQRLGTGKVLRIVEELLATDRLAFEKAIYWIVIHQNGPDHKYWPQYVRMLKAAKHLGIHLAEHQSRIADE